MKENIAYILYKNTVAYCRVGGRSPPTLHNIQCIFQKNRFDVLLHTSLQYMLQYVLENLVKTYREMSRILIYQFPKYILWKLSKTNPRIFLLNILVCFCDRQLQDSLGISISMKIENPEYKVLQNIKKQNPRIFLLNILVCFCDGQLQISSIVYFPKSIYMKMENPDS